MMRAASSSLPTAAAAAGSARAALERVRAPTLLIVGGSDAPVIQLNRNARDRMAAETRIVIVPGATHLFEEAGTLDQVVDHATGWFLAYMPEAKNVSPDIRR